MSMTSRLSPRSVHVWIVAEDPLVGGNLAAALEREADLSIVGQLVPSEVDGLRVESREQGSPGRDSGGQTVVWDLGPRALAAAEERAFGMPIPVLALVAGSGDALAAIGRGAAGAVRRDASPARIAAALHGIASGLVVLDRDTASTLFRGRDNAADLVSEPLTPRELEVLQHLASGLANKEIARLLGISEHTVKFHVNAILAKLGAQGRTEAVVRAARLGLVVL